MAKTIWTESDIETGTYTPTITDIVNGGTVTSDLCQYMKVGNMITVIGKINTDFLTAGANSEFKLSLPISSDFIATYDCGGSAISRSVADSDTLVILADATNNKAHVTGVPSNAGAVPYYLHFTYRLR